MILVDTDILSAMAKIVRIQLLFTLLQTPQIHITPGVFGELAHSFNLRRQYLDNVTLANPRLRERRIAWAQAPSSLWEGPEFSETARRNLPWNRAKS
jgi:predicted nucleic acid-binding protein